MGAPAKKRTWGGPVTSGLSHHTGASAALATQTTEWLSRTHSAPGARSASSCRSRLARQTLPSTSMTTSGETSPSIAVAMWMARANTGRAAVNSADSSPSAVRVSISATGSILHPELERAI